MASLSYEKRILNAIVDLIKEYNYIIKPHPSDDIELKYNKGINVADNIALPWEVEKVMNMNKSARKKQVYLSLTPTGAILNDIVIWGEDSIVIFLDKVYKNFGVYPVYEERLESFIRFAEIEGKLVYRPNNLQELKRVLRENIPDMAIVEDTLEIDEKNIDVENKILATEYHKIAKTIFSDLNVGTLFVYVDGLWHEIGQRKYLISEYNGEIKFEIEQSIILESCKDDFIKFRWYIARGSILKIKVNEIIFSCGNRVIKNDIDKLKYLDAEEDTLGWHSFNNCDPQIEFAVKREYVESKISIAIHADIKFDCSFDGMLRLRTRDCELLGNTIVSLTNDNAVREQNIIELKEHLNNWINMAGEREKELQDTIGQREELNAILLHERFEASKKISEYIKIVEEQEKVLSSLYNFISYKIKKKRDN